jgi:peptidylprolyl isomerase
MKRVLLVTLLASAAGVLAAQTASKPASTTASAAKPATHSTASATSGIKLPPGVPAVRGILKTAFALKYQDTKIGTGALAEPNKVYKVHYTLWLAADGRKVDSSFDHPAMPVFDDTGKPVMGADGKQKQEAGQPLRFIQGAHRVIPGWDQGFDGMKIGGKRRLFIPWQLAYGATGSPSRDPKNPGIPPKADLIFDIELVNVTDMPAMPTRPPAGAMGGPRPIPGAPMQGAPSHAPGQPAAPAGSTAPAPATAAPAAAPATTPTTAPATPAPAAPVTAPQPK